MSHRKALARAVGTLGGIWDTDRAVTTLKDAGYGDGDRRDQEKRARRALRLVASDGLLVRIHDEQAIYRAVRDG